MKATLAPDPQQPSRYQQMVRTLRSFLVDEKDCHYYAHTPVGRINVTKWNYTIPGFVAISGEDEHKKFRFVVFSEEQACSFPLEVHWKDQDSAKGPLGFIPKLQDDMEDRSEH